MTVAADDARPLDRQRLAKALGMLGSAHDGEVVAAARAVEGMRRAAGLTWLEIISPAPRLPKPGRRRRKPRRQRPVMSDAEAVEFLLRRPERLTDWELAFARSLRAWRGTLTKKQKAVLARLVARAEDDF